MGCRSDYMEPDATEVENSKLDAMLEELKTGKLPKYFGTGMLADGNYADRGQLTANLKTKKLCGELKKKSTGELKKLSLETQLWWRDHKVADKRHAVEDAAEKKRKAVAKKALEKLSPAERKALNL